MSVPSSLGTPLEPIAILHFIPCHQTRYAYRLAMPGAPPIYKLPDPDGYTPAHLYLLARHGTRWPTADRMKQINSLEQLFRVRC